MDIVTADVYLYIAINIGLMILACWFAILYLILREFRLFAVKMVRGHAPAETDPIVEKCRDSIDKTMQFVENNKKTISELAEVQIALEQQLANIRNSTQDHITDEEQASIDALNKKLMRSHKLIKKLKGDLDTSVTRLKKTKRKLFDQYDSVDALKKENQTLQEQLDSAGDIPPDGLNEQEIDQMMATFEKEKLEMGQAIEQYKKQIIEQNQAIEQLMAQSPEGEVDTASFNKMQSELTQAKQALKHISKEKKFIESRYMELAKAQKQGN